MSARRIGAWVLAVGGACLLAFSAMIGAFSPDPAEPAAAAPRIDEGAAPTASDAAPGHDFAATRTAAPSNPPADSPTPGIVVTHSDGRRATGLPYAVVDQRVLLASDWDRIAATWEETDDHGRIRLESLPRDGDLAIVMASHIAAVFSRVPANATVTLPPLDDVVIEGFGFAAEAGWFVSCSPPQEDTIAWIEHSAAGWTGTAFTRTVNRRHTGNGLVRFRQVKGAALSLRATGSSAEVALGMTDITCPARVPLQPVGEGRNRIRVRLVDASGNTASATGWIRVMAWPQLVETAGTQQPSVAFASDMTSGLFDVQNERVDTCGTYTVEVVVSGSHEFFQSSGQVGNVEPRIDVTFTIGRGSSPLIADEIPSEIASIYVADGESLKAIQHLSSPDDGPCYTRAANVVFLHGVAPGSAALVLCRDGRVLGCTFASNRETVAPLVDTTAVAIEPRHFGYPSGWPAKTWLALEIVIPSTRGGKQSLVDQIFCHELGTTEPWHKHAAALPYMTEVTLYGLDRPMSRYLHELSR